LSEAKGAGPRSSIMIGKVAGTEDLPRGTRVARQCERTDHRLQPGKGIPRALL